MQLPAIISADIADYDRDGFMIFRGVIDADLLAEARSHVEWLQHRYPDIRPEHLHHPLMRDDAYWVRMVTDACLLHIVQAFMGPNLACFTSHYICKPPRDGQAVLWHQDGAYWNLQPMQALTVWVAIDDSTPENGCLRMIPGSHRSPMGNLVMRDDIPNMLHSSIDPRLVETEKAVDVHLKAGDVSIHHPLIIHGSEPNRSVRRRCGLDIGYIRTDTRIGDTGLYINPLLVAGEAVPSINRYRPWPAFDAGRTIVFAGHEHWDQRAREANRRPGTVMSLPDEPDVRELTERMMERLRDGTTAAPRTSPVECTPTA